MNSPHDEIIKQLVFHRVDVGDTHHVSACVTNDYHVSRDVEAPLTVKAVIWCQTLWTVANENGIMVLERVLRV